MQILPRLVELQRECGGNEFAYRIVAVFTKKIPQYDLEKFEAFLRDGEERGCFAGKMRRDSLELYEMFHHPKKTVN
jgi:hypothetical protein